MLKGVNKLNTNIQEELELVEKLMFDKRNLYS
jgi:hypothetical protein